MSLSPSTRPCPAETGFQPRCTDPARGPRGRRPERVAWERLRPCARLTAPPLSSRSETPPTGATRCPWRPRVCAAGRPPRSTACSSPRSPSGWRCGGGGTAGCCECRSPGASGCGRVSPRGVGTAGSLPSPGRPGTPRRRAPRLRGRVSPQAGHGGGAPLLRRPVPAAVHLAAVPAPRRPRRAPRAPPARHQLDQGHPLEPGHRAPGSGVAGPGWGRGGAGMGGVLPGEEPSAVALCPRPT